jgi:hypothetical protein
VDRLSRGVPPPLQARSGVRLCGTELRRGRREEADAALTRVVMMGEKPRRGTLFLYQPWSFPVVQGLPWSFALSPVAPSRRSTARPRVSIPRVPHRERPLRHSPSGGALWHVARQDTSRETRAGVGAVRSRMPREGAKGRHQELARRVPGKAPIGPAPRAQDRRRSAELRVTLCQWPIVERNGDLSSWR